MQLLSLRQTRSLVLELQPRGKDIFTISSANWGNYLSGGDPMCAEA